MNTHGKNSFIRPVYSLIFDENQMVTGGLGNAKVLVYHNASALHMRVNVLDYVGLGSSFTNTHTYSSPKFCDPNHFSEEK